MSYPNYRNSRKKWRNDDDKFNSDNANFTPLGPRPNKPTFQKNFPPKMLPEKSGNFSNSSGFGNFSGNYTEPNYQANFGAPANFPAPQFFPQSNQGMNMNNFQNMPSNFGNGPPGPPPFHQQHYPNCPPNMTGGNALQGNVGLRDVNMSVYQQPKQNLTVGVPFNTSLPPPGFMSVPNSNINSNISNQAQSNVLAYISLPPPVPPAPPLTLEPVSSIPLPVPPVTSKPGSSIDLKSISVPPPPITTVATVSSVVSSVMSQSSSALPKFLDIPKPNILPKSPAPTTSQIKSVTLTMDESLTLSSVDVKRKEENKEKKDHIKINSMDETAPSSEYPPKPQLSLNNMDRKSFSEVMEFLEGGAMPSLGTTNTENPISSKDKISEKSKSSFEMDSENSYDDSLVRTMKSLSGDQKKEVETKDNFTKTVNTKEQNKEKINDLPKEKINNLPQTNEACIPALMDLEISVVNSKVPIEVSSSIIVNKATAPCEAPKLLDTSISIKECDLKDEKINPGQSSLYESKNANVDGNKKTDLLKKENKINEENLNKSEVMKVTSDLSNKSDSSLNKKENVSKDIEPPTSNNENALDKVASSPPRRIILPCLSKEAAKKRLRSFSTNKLIVKDRSKAQNPLFELENKTNVENNDEDSISPYFNKKKKKKEKLSVISQIKDEEMRIKEVLNLTYSYNQHVMGFGLPNLTNLFDNPEALKKFEERGRDFKEMLERKDKPPTTTVRNEEEKNLQEAAPDIESKKDRHCKDQSRTDKERSKERSSKHTGTKESGGKSSRPRIKEPPKNWKEVKKLGMTLDEISKCLKYERSRSRSRSQGRSRKERRYDRSSSRDRGSFKRASLSPFPESPKQLLPVKVRRSSGTKEYRGSMVNYTQSKPPVCFSVNSSKFDQHYWSRKELKQRNQHRPYIKKIIEDFWKSEYGPFKSKDKPMRFSRWFTEHYLEENADSDEDKLKEEQIKEIESLDLSSSNCDPDAITEKQNLHDHSANMDKEEKMDIDTENSFSSKTMKETEENLDPKVSHSVKVLSEDCTLNASELKDEYETFISTLEKNPEEIDNNLNKPFNDDSSISSKKDLVTAQNENDSEINKDPNVFVNEFKSEDLTSATTKVGKKTDIAKSASSRSNLPSDLPTTKNEVKELLQNSNLTKKEKKVLKKLKKKIKREKKEKKKMKKELKKKIKQEKLERKKMMKKARLDDARFQYESDIIPNLLDSSGNSALARADCEEKVIKPLANEYPQEIPRIVGGKPEYDISMSFEHENMSIYNENYVSNLNSGPEYSTFTEEKKDYSSKSVVDTSLSLQNDYVHSDGDQSSHSVVSSKDNSYSTVSNSYSSLVDADKDNSSHSVIERSISPHSPTYQYSSDSEALNTIPEEPKDASYSDSNIESAHDGDDKYSPSNMSVCSTDSHTGISFSPDLSKAAAEPITSEVNYVSSPYSPSSPQTSDFEDDIPSTLFIPSLDSIPMPPSAPKSSGSLSSQHTSASKMDKTKTAYLPCQSSLSSKSDSSHFDKNLISTEATATKDSSYDSSILQTTKDESRKRLDDDTSNSLQKISQPVVFRLGSRHSLSLKKAPLRGFNFNEDEDDDQEQKSSIFSSENESSSNKKGRTLTLVPFEKDEKQKEDTSKNDKDLPNSEIEKRKENELECASVNVPVSSIELLSDFRILESFDKSAHSLKDGEKESVKTNTASPGKLSTSIEPKGEVTTDIVSKEFGKTEHTSEDSGTKNDSSRYESKDGKNRGGKDDRKRTSYSPRRREGREYDSPNKRDRRRDSPASSRRRRSSRSPISRRHHSPDRYSSRRRSRSPFTSSRDRPRSPHRSRHGERDKRSQSPSKHRKRSPPRRSIGSSKDYSPLPKEKIKRMDATYSPGKDNDNLSPSIDKIHTEVESINTECQFRKTIDETTLDTSDFVARPIDSISNLFDQREKDTNWNWEGMHDYENTADEANEKPKSPELISPKRLSLNERLKQEHGVEIEEEAKALNNEYNQQDYFWDQNLTEQGAYASSGDTPHVIRVGNVLQVLPQEPLSEVSEATSTAGAQNISQNNQTTLPEVNIIQVLPNAAPHVNTTILEPTTIGRGWRIEGVEADLSVPPPPIPKVQTPIVPATYAEISPVPPPSTMSSLTSNPMAYISSLIASSMSKPANQAEALPSTSIVSTNPVDSNTQGGVGIVPPPCTSSQTEVSSGHNVAFKDYGVEQQKEIITAVVAAASGVSTSSSSIAQLLSVLQKQNLIGQSATTPAAEVTSTTSAVAPPPEATAPPSILPPAFDLEAFREQRKERKEKKKREREAKSKAKREKALLKKQELERNMKEGEEMLRIKENHHGDDDDDDDVLKEAMTEVPELGSPVPDYEIYIDEDNLDEAEDEDEKPEPIPIPDAPEKGILLCPTLGICNDNRRKSVSFADGVIPGYGTSPSGGEEIHSPPPPISAAKSMEKEKKKRLRRKKKVKVKLIKQFVPGDSGLDSPPPPPEIPTNGGGIRLYPGCTHYTCTGPATFVIYTQQSQEQPASSDTSEPIHRMDTNLTIPPGMLVHSSALSKNYSTGMPSIGMTTNHIPPAMPSGFPVGVYPDPPVPSGASNADSVSAPVLQSPMG